MDKQFMMEAIKLARKGSGFVNPNPLVGAVIVKNGKVIGQGYHERYGGPHAEVNAVNNAKESVEGATIYVTLEPCFHYGKTPPCVDLIIKKHFSKVVIGMKDPNPLVAGKSIEKLMSQKIEVVVGILEDEIREMNRVFIKYITEKKPYVIMKTAMTLDGKISTKTGDSKWISGEASRRLVHQMRHDMMGIMVGIGTVLKDDPSLTTRQESQEGLNPRPIIIDSKGRLPLTSRLLKEHDKGTIILGTTEHLQLHIEEALKAEGVTIIKTSSIDGKVNLPELMIELGKLGIDSILLEGGSTLNGNAMEAGIVDEVVSFIAPKIIGGRGVSPVGGEGVENIKDAKILEQISVQSIGEDILVRGKVRR